MMENIRVFTCRNFLMIGCVIALCMGLSYSAHASIGTESSDQTTETDYSQTDAMSAMPPYPAGAAPEMGNTMPPVPPMFLNAPMGSNAPMNQPYGDTRGIVPAPSSLSPQGTMSPMLPYGNMYAPMQPYSYPSSQPQASPYGIVPTYPDFSQSSGYPIPGLGYQYPQQQYGSADQLYNQAMQIYRSRDYWTALAKFRDVANFYPQSDLADNAYYWMGEIYYAWRNFPAALQTFQMVMYSYPTGNKAADAYLKMGYTYSELRQYQAARSVLNDVVARFGNNTRIRNLAIKKLNEIGNMY